MLGEDTNICNECGHEGPEGTCPYCEGKMASLEDLDEEEGKVDAEVDEGEEEL